MLSPFDDMFGIRLCFETTFWCIFLPIGVIEKAFALCIDRGVLHQIYGTIQPVNRTPIKATKDFEGLRTWNAAEEGLSNVLGTVHGRQGRGAAYMAYKL